MKFLGYQYRISGKVYLKTLQPKSRKTRILDLDRLVWSKRPFVGYTDIQNSVEALVNREGWGFPEGNKVTSIDLNVRLKRRKILWIDLLSALTGIQFGDIILSVPGTYKTPQSC